jgi:hypothetical protein
MSSPALHPQEGRLAIVTDVGSGMRWAYWRARRARSMRTAKSCGPDLPTLGSSLCVTNAQTMVAKKPGTPRRARDTPSNHCAGNAGCFGVPVVTAACFFVAGGPWVRPAPGIPCALFIQKGRERCITRAFRAARMHCHIPRHCERSEAIHSAASGRMDCFAALAMTTRLAV